MKKALIIASVASMIEQFNMSNIRLLKESGYEVDVATNFQSSGTITSDRSNELKDELKAMKIKCIQIDFDRGILSASNIKAYKQIKKVINNTNYDIIHMHSPIGGVCGRIAARKTRKLNGTRVIYTAHGFHFYKGGPILNWIIFYPIEKFLSKYTDCLITINQEDYDLAKNKFKARQTELVHGVGVDEDKFNFDMTKEEKEELRKNLGLKNDDFVLIQVGELNKNKNQIMAINAMKEIVKQNKNIKLLLVGRGKLEKEYQKEIKKYNLQDNVLLLGYRKDVANIIKISDCGIALSKREGLGLNLIEEIYSGIPVVATNNRGHKEIVKNGINGYLIKNKDEIVEKIISFTNKEIYNTLIQSSEETVKKFLLKRIINNIKYIYENKINDKETIRVLHILHKLDMGGTENFIMNIYRNIDRTKIQFDFLVHGKGIFDYEVQKLGGRIYYFNGYVNEIGIKKYKNELKKFFTKNSYRIIHSHVDQTSGLIAEVVKKHSNAICVTHSHSVDNYNHFFVKLYKKWLQIKLNKYADIRLACSEEAGKWLYGNNEFTVIKNAIDIKKFSYNEKIRREIRKKLNIKDNELIIGHIGRFEKVKNHEFLIDIFKQYNLINSNSRLMLIGEGSLKNTIKCYAKKQKLESKILFLGVKEDVNIYYNAMDLFLFPSIKEGLGIVLIEAQANGLYVVTSKGVPKESAVTNNIEFIDLKERKKWIEAITKFDNKNNNRFIGIDSEYNINNTTNKIVKIYQESVRKYEK